MHPQKQQQGKADCKQELVVTGLVIHVMRRGPCTKRLLLALLCVVGVVAQTGFVSAASLTPAQVSGTTWELIESDYPDAVFRDVAFIDSTHGWIVGQTSENWPSDLIVLHTSDGGDSWQLQYTHSPGWVTIMDVVDEHTIWVNGLGSLYCTLDSGETWSESVVVGGMSGMSTVKFMNHTHGWTGNNGVLYKTTDGGQSWQSVPGWGFDDSPRMIEVLSPLDIWACGYSGIYHSTDEGETWTKVFDRGGWTMSFVSDVEAWAVGDNMLAHMTDGENWTELTVPGGFPWFRLMGPYLSDIQFIDKDHGWIVGMETPVMYTPDGGANWYRQSVSAEVADTDPPIMAVYCINQTHGWAVGWRGTILKTTSANSLGVRLWGGSADPLLLSAIAAVVVVIAGGIIVFRRRKYKPIMSRPQGEPASPELV